MVALLACFSGSLLLLQGRMHESAETVVRIRSTDVAAHVARYVSFPHQGSCSPTTVIIPHHKRPSCRSCCRSR